MTSAERASFYDAIVIGGGPAGLTAGLYLARACYRVLVIEKEKFGGQITITAEVVNYPGAEPMSGEALTERMRLQAEQFGAEFLLAEVLSLREEEGFYRISTSKGDFLTHGVILATGAHPRMIGFPGEAEYKGHGVAYCATCDGEFFTGREVFVVGGGFAAAEEAVFLTKYASHVTILIREPDFTCAAKVAEPAKQHEKITVKYDTEVEEVSGDSLLRRIRYRNSKTGEVTEFSPADGGSFGVFVFAGYAPSAGLLSGLAELDEHGYVLTDRNQKTSRDGIYAAGDVCQKNLRQVVTATGDGATAATELEKYISVRQRETGVKAEIQTKRAAVHAAQDSAPAAAAVQSGNTPFDSAMVQQLNTVFSRLTEGLTLKLYTDEGAVSSELRHYLEALTALSDKLTLSEESAPDPLVNGEPELPYVRVFRADGSYAGICFHGVPGGHEFTSFVLGLYNAGSPGQAVSEELRSRIDALQKDISLKIFVSLSCTMCPELVTSAQRIATLNPNVKTEVYDLNRFPALRDRYEVMSVPCFLINDAPPQFGKKDIAQLLDLLGA